MIITRILAIILLSGRPCLRAYTPLRFQFQLLDLSILILPFRLVYSSRVAQDIFPGSSLFLFWLADYKIYLRFWRVLA